MSTLTPEQLKTLDQRLTERHAALRGELQSAAEQQGQYGRLSGEAPDHGDNSVADLLTDLNNAEMSRDLNELREIEAARRRVQDGTYGECLDCGQDIAYGRLQAYPTAIRCVACQEQYEKTHATAPRPSM